MAGAVRTPIGKFGGSLAGLTAADLGASTASEALRRAGVRPDQVEETTFGCARQAGAGPNVARQVSFRAGVPREVTAYTINMACGSGLKAIDLAHRAVRDGDADVVLAGGTESMSRVPYLLTQARWGYRMGDQPAVDAMYQDGFSCPLAGQLMGETAERLATDYGISREEQDAFAARSQERAARAQAEGRFQAETFPVLVPGRKGETEFSRDEHVRSDATLGGLAKLAPVFKAGSGTVTAGNSSGITDGAAAIVVLSRARAEEIGVKIQARVLGVAQAGVDPQVMGLGVVPAVKRLLARLSLRLARLRPDRGQRGLRGPGARLRSRAPVRPRAAQREWRRDRSRAPDRGHGRPHLRDPSPRDGAEGRAPRACRSLHQRGHGHGCGVRGGMNRHQEA